MLYLDKYKGTDREQFEQRVREVAVNLGVNPDWLMCVFYLESSVNPAAVNSTTGATGLIQFMPATAKNLGTTTTALAAMSGTEQMQYVYNYLKPYAGRLSSLVDCYFAVFFPAAIGKDDNWVLKTSKLSAAIIAKQNSGYDLDHNGELTVGEVRTAICRRLGIEEKTDGTIKKK